MGSGGFVQDTPPRVFCPKTVEVSENKGDAFVLTPKEFATITIEKG
jgi:hypothetical protein